MASAVPDRPPVHARRGHLAAIPGPSPQAEYDEPGDEPGPARRVLLTPASAIEMRPVRWLWDGRIPVGAIALVPGREGIGKSLFLAWLTARITTGTLPGVLSGQPRPVIYAATEDSWSHTIAPRLYVAGADLDMVYRADIETPDGAAGFLTLPVDCDGLAAEIGRLGVALLAADPLLSLIHASIDTHRDRDLRTVLEPLFRMADQTGCAVVGLAHFNKSTSADALNLITGSRAFSAVARAVLPVARDTSADDGTCVMSQAKNNLGRLDLPSLRYRIDTAEVPTPEGPAQVGKLVFTGETDRSVADILNDASQPSEGRADRDEAAAWLTAYLTSHGGEALFKDIRNAARAEGIAERTLQRARERAGVTSHPEGFPARNIWRLTPATHGDQSCQSRQSRQDSERGATGMTVAPLPGPDTHSDHHPSAGPADIDALFEAIEDVIAYAHPVFGRRGTASNSELPAAITDAVAGLADTHYNATGAGPHDDLITAARKVIAAVTSHSTSPRDLAPAFASLAHALPPTG